MLLVWVVCLTLIRVCSQRLQSSHMSPLASFLSGLTVNSTSITMTLSQHIWAVFWCILTMRTERHKFWIHSMILYLDWLLTRQDIGAISSLKLILLAISARDRAESIASGTLFQRLSTHFFIHFPPNAKFWKILSTASKMWHVGSVAIISFMDNFNHFDKNVYFKTLLFLQRVRSDFGLSCLMSVNEEETINRAEGNENSEVHCCCES